MRPKKLLEHLIDRFPVIISHINGEFRIVDVQLVFFVLDEAPKETILGGIVFEGIELVFRFEHRFTALGLNHPNRAIFFHNNIVCVEQLLDWRLSD